MESVEISDGVIILKPFRTEDAKKHLEGNDIEQERWLSGDKSTIDSVRNWIKRNQKFWEKDGPIFNFSIRIIESNELIGMIEANIDSKNVEGIKDGDANISYSLYPKARGKGFMIRAVNLIQKFLKEKDVKRAVIRVDPENKNSLKVPLRCGFIKNGQIVTEKGNGLVIFINNL